MTTSDRLGTAGYTIIVAGVVLAFASAVVPFFDAGYHLRLGVLSAALLPYLVYAVVVELLRRPGMLVAGIFLLVIHLGVVIRERFLGGADYSDGLIFYVPIVLAVVLLPLSLIALHRAMRE